MEWKIPYFEYDVFARIAPGALTMAVAIYCEVPVPAYWEPLLSPTKGVLDTGTVVFGGLTLLAASYIIGLIYEALLSFLWRFVSPEALNRAAKERKTWLRPVARTVTATDYEAEDLFKILIQWLLHSTNKGVRYGFVHMHRFQAEARLCTYSIIPLHVLVPAAFIKGDGEIGVGAFVMVFLLVRCAWLREKRRWVQALAMLDELRPDRPELDVLQKQLEDLGKSRQSPNPWHKVATVVYRVAFGALLLLLLLLWFSAKIWRR